MTQDLLQTLSFWFTQAAKFWFTVRLPGTNVSCGGMLLFISSAYIGLKFLQGLFSGGHDNGEK